jgi:hypothetical protein
VTELLFGVSDPLCLSSSSALHIFLGIILTVFRDAQHLLAHAMASDFSVTRQFSLKENNCFFVMDQTPHPT